MRFLHLSDLHLGLKLIGRDLLEDQRYILQQVLAQAADTRPDALLIAGDIYDKAIPPAEAVELFDWFIAALKKELPDTALMMISGNHDSAQRLDIYRSVLEEEKLFITGLPPMRAEEHIRRVRLTDAFGPVNFYLLPFVRPTMLKGILGTDPDGRNFSYEASLKRLLDREKIDPTERNVLLSHQFYLPAGSRAEEVERTDSEIRTVGNIDEVKSTVLMPFDYAALGHIHKPMTVGRAFYRYCGSPLAYSVSEAGQRKSMLLIELLEKGTPAKIDPLPLTPLREVRVIRGTLEQVLKQPSKDYVSIVLTDMRDLDIIDMQEKIRRAFPYVLEIRREKRDAPRERSVSQKEEKKDPFQICEDFLSGMDEQEEEIMKDIINSCLAAER